MSEDRTPESMDNPGAEDSPEPPEVAPAASDADDAPMNRAERRAKGKKSAQQSHAGGKQKFTPKSAPAASTRQWANRRSG